MNELQELIKAADNLCNRLDVIANEEKNFCVDVCLAFERYSWEMLRMANDLKEIKNQWGI